MHLPRIYLDVVKLSQVLVTEGKRKEGQRDSFWWTHKQNLQRTVVIAVGTESRNESSCPRPAAVRGLGYLPWLCSSPLPAGETRELGKEEARSAKCGRVSGT